MKKYIFMTADIHPIGGMQNYVAGKAKFLEKNGWEVYMFFFGNNSSVCTIPSLNKYVKGGLYELSRQPYAWPALIRKSVLNKMIRLVGTMKTRNDEIVIESQSDITALWGELLAKEISAKNVCFICNELFRGGNKYYWENIQFFDFKHLRRELCGIQKESLSTLFNGYKVLDDDEKYCFVPANEGPIQDVDNKKVDDLETKDWNICYIGRARKEYVEVIVKDVAKFAKKYSSRQIQFIMVGDARTRVELLKSTLKPIENIEVVLLGDLVPIPRNLFSKVDVVIAGAGCARCSAMENVPVIVAEAQTFLSNGILGYTTYNNIIKDSKEGLRHYDEMLEQVLVKKVCEKLSFYMPAREEATYYYKMHMDFVENSSQKEEYFELNQKVEKVGKKELLKYYILKYTPQLYAFYEGLRHE